MKLCDVTKQTDIQNLYIFCCVCVCVRAGCMCINYFRERCVCICVYVLYYEGWGGREGY